MVSTGPKDLASVAEMPPAYQTPAHINPHADNSSSENKGLQPIPPDDDLPATASTSHPQRAGAPIRSKPIIVQLRRRKVVDAKKFVVEELGNIKVLKIQKDIVLLNPTMAFEEIGDLLLLRSQERGILPAQIDSESTWSLISISTNHKKFSSDIVGLDSGSWEAGRELLLTREDAILRLDVVVTTEEYAEYTPEKQSTKKNKCIVQ